MECIARAYTMDGRIHPEVSISGRLHQLAYLVFNLTIFDTNETDLANTPTLTLGSFEVYSSKRIHIKKAGREGEWENEHRVWMRG